MLYFWAGIEVYNMCKGAKQMRMKMKLLLMLRLVLVLQTIFPFMRQLGNYGSRF